MTKAKAKKKPSKLLKGPRIPIEVLTARVEGSQFIKAFFDLTHAQAVQITNALVQAVRASLSRQGKGGNALALNEWRDLLLPAVYQRLLSGGNWATEGPNVLRVADDMGTIAGLLSGAAAEAGPNQLKGAFGACKNHTTCSTGGVGGGAWCTFDWI